ncbi:hypothetical protein OIE66_37075 [Nonomuraea sp. NBC_01738]|uniref:hypothetical protein n=1 Tax=Nonomuraea sp. NBC_01738 TaxID=2976003 RepID=UPI002E1680F7|nr:hypothetical protein OIE66_37075 [Nonomuraea sp. NBC_01738]
METSRLAEATAALETTLATLEDAGVDPLYRLGGTGAALLQGVDLPVGDIDLLMSRREEVDAVAAALSSFPCLYAPAWLPESQQYFARFEVKGVDVEISTVERETSSDCMECIGRGPWEHFVLVPCGRFRVPAIRLELRLATELLRDRPDRYEPLLAHMARHGYDPDLLDRATIAHALPPASRLLPR